MVYGGLWSFFTTIWWLPFSIGSCKLHSSLRELWQVSIGPKTFYLEFCNRSWQYEPTLSHAQPDNKISPALWIKYFFAWIVDFQKIYFWIKKVKKLFENQFLYFPIFFRAGTEKNWPHFFVMTFRLNFDVLTNLIVKHWSSGLITLIINLIFASSFLTFKFLA